MKHLFTHIYAPLAWTIAVQILLCLPGSAIPSAPFAIPDFDKAIHFVIYAGFVLLWSYYFFNKQLAFRQLKRTFFFIFLLASAHGIVIEFIQLNLIPYRSFDKADIIADLLGSGLAYGMANLKWLQAPHLKI